MRTLLTLDVLGFIDKYAGVFNLTVYYANKASYIGQVLADRTNESNKEVYDEMVLRHFPIPFLSWMHFWKYTIKARLSSVVGRLRHEPR